MSRWESGLQHTATLLVGGTGLVYAAMRYLMTPDDPWAVVNHPWQPHAQHLHVLFAPLLVFAAGLIWRRHVIGGARNGGGRHRFSGLGVAATFVPMVASGYLIQTTTGAGWRSVWVAVHLVASSLWLAGYLVHQLTGSTAEEAQAEHVVQGAGVRGLD